MPLLVCGLGQDLFAIPVYRVDEVLRMAWITRLPEAPPEVLGCLRLRGGHVLVIDLACRLGLPTAAMDASQILVLVTVRGRRFALRASGVEEFLEGSVEPLPEGSPSVPCAIGLISTRSGTVPLLDLDAVLHPELVRLASTCGDEKP